MRFLCFLMICNEHYWYLHPYRYTGVKILLGTSLLVLIQFDVFHTFSNTLVILQYLQSTTWFTWGIHSLEWSDLPCKLHFHCLLFFFIYFFYDELSIIYFCVLSCAIHSFCFHLSFCLSFSFSSTFCLVDHLLLILLLFQCLFQFIYFFHLDFFFVLTLLMSIPNSPDIIIFWQKVMTQLFLFFYCLFIDCSVFLSSLLFWILWYINIAYCILPDMARFHQQPYIWCCYWELKYPPQKFSLFSFKFFNFLFRDVCPCLEAISECCLQECLK